MIRWIGWDFEPNRKQKAFPPTLLKSRDSTGGSQGEETKFELYGLTVEGHAVSVDEYALRLANNKSTHVVLFQDWDSGSSIGEKDVVWTEPFNELKL